LRTRSWRGARVACLVAAELLLLGVFVTPVGTLAFHYLLSAHLLQNVVLAEWAPALVVLSLAPPLAGRIDRVRAVRALTHPFVALPVWLVVYDTWHVPRLYDAALRHPNSLLHLEHASYLVCGLLLWWPVFQGERLTDAGRATYAFAAFVLASPLGLLLALLPRPLYDVYVEAPRIWVSALTDQQLAGIAMATEEAVVFFGVFVWAFMRVLSNDAD
jgi:cytochrome c oxidase assembly factor CtaG